MEIDFYIKLTTIVERHMSNENFGVSELANEMGISRTSLHRKVKNCTGKSVSKFLCEFRLSKAFELLKQNSGNVSEVAYTVGFNSVSYFNKCFHEFYNVTPGNVLNGVHSKKSFNISKNNKRNRKYLLYALPIFVVIISLFSLFFLNPNEIQPNTGDKILYFEQFDDFSNEKLGKDFINGLEEHLIEHFKEINGIYVNEKLIVKKFKSRNERNITYLNKFNADYIIEGKINKLSDGDLVVMLLLTDLNNVYTDYSQRFHHYPY